MRRFDTFWNSRLAAIAFCTAIWTLTLPHATASLHYSVRQRLNTWQFKRGTLAPNSQVLAGVDSDNSIRLWDLGLQTEVASLDGHLEPVRHLSFTADSRFLASRDDDQLRFWDAATGKLLSVMSTEEQSVESYTLSADGRFVAISSVSGVELWSLETYKQLYRKECRARHMAFSPNCQLLAVSSSKGQGRVDIWNTKGELVHTIRGHAWRLTFSADSKLLAAESTGRSQRIIDVENKTIVSKTSLGFEPKRLLFVPSSRYLVAIGRSSVAIIDPTSGQVLRRLGSIVAISSSSQWLVVEGDKHFELWDIYTAEHILNLPDQLDGVFSVADDGDEIYAKQGVYIQRWRLPTARIVEGNSRSRTVAERLRRSRDIPLISLGIPQEIFRDAFNGEMSVTKDGFVFVSSKDIVVADPEVGRLAFLDRPVDSMYVRATDYTLCLSDDGRTCIVGNGYYNKSDKITVVNLPTREERGYVQGIPLFFANNRTLVTAHNTGRSGSRRGGRSTLTGNLRAYDIVEGTDREFANLGSLQARLGRLSGDGSFAVLSSPSPHDGYWCFHYEFHTSKVTKLFSRNRSRGDTPLIALSENDQRVACAYQSDSSPTISIGNRDGRFIEVACPDHPQDIEFSPDGDLLAGVFSGGMVRFWSSDNGRIASEIHAPGQLESLSFSPDGKRLVVVGSVLTQIDVTRFQLLASSLEDRTRRSGRYGDSISDFEDVVYLRDGTGFVTSEHRHLHFWRSEVRTNVRYSETLSADRVVVITDLLADKGFLDGTSRTGLQVLNGSDQLTLALSLPDQLWLDPEIHSELAKLRTAFYEAGVTDRITLHICNEEFQSFRSIDFPEQNSNADEGRSKRKLPE